LLEKSEKNPDFGRRTLKRISLATKVEKEDLKIFIQENNNSIFAGLAQTLLTYKERSRGEKETITNYNASYGGAFLINDKEGSGKGIIYSGDYAGAYQKNSGNYAGAYQKNLGNNAGRKQLNSGYYAGTKQKNSGNFAGACQINSGDYAGAKQKNSGNYAGAYQVNSGDYAGAWQKNIGNKAGRNQKNSGMGSSYKDNKKESTLKNLIPEPASNF